MTIPSRMLAAAHISRGGIKSGHIQERSIDTIHQCQELDRSARFLFCYTVKEEHT